MSYSEMYPGNNEANNFDFSLQSDLDYLFQGDEEIPFEAKVRMSVLSLTTKVKQQMEVVANQRNAIYKYNEDKAIDQMNYSQLQNPSMRRIQPRPPPQQQQSVQPSYQFQQPNQSFEFGKVDEAFDRGNGRGNMLSIQSGSTMSEMNFISPNNFKFQMGGGDSSNPVFLIPAQMNNNQIFLLPCFLPQSNNNNGDGSQQQPQQYQQQYQQQQQQQQQPFRFMNLNEFYSRQQQQQGFQQQPGSSTPQMRESEVSRGRIPSPEISHKQQPTSPLPEDSVDNKGSTCQSASNVLGQRQENWNEQEQYQIMKKRMERQFKIEKYKSKKRNWLKKVDYDCRQKLAGKRLRIKGRFISKDDSDRLVGLYGQIPEDFISLKRNLNISMIPGVDVIKVSDTKRRRLKAIKKLIETSKIELASVRLSSKLATKERIFKVSRKL